MTRVTTSLSVSRAFLVYVHCSNMVIISPLLLSKYFSLNNKLHGHCRSGAPTEPSQGQKIGEGISGIELWAVF